MHYPKVARGSRKGRTVKDPKNYQAARTKEGPREEQLLNT